MSWVKQANKLGRYRSSYKGFRIYVTKEPTHKETIVRKDDGLYRRTDFTKGDYLAIDKTGLRLTSNSVEDLGCKIDMETLRRYFEKKEGVPIVFR